MLMATRVLECHTDCPPCCHGERMLAALWSRSIFHRAPGRYVGDQQFAVRLLLQANWQLLQ
jgi:hypothetical protein